MKEIRNCIVPTFVFLNLFVLGWASNCFAAPAQKLDDLAKAIAKEIAPEFAKYKASGASNVAVFKFTDKNGKYDPNTMGSLGDISASLLQDELRTTLSTGATSKKYTVLDKFNIDLLFTATSTSQLGIHSGNPNQVRKDCGKASIDVAVVTRFQMDDVAKATNGLDPIDVEVTVIFPNSDKSFVVSTEPGVVLVNSGLPQSGTLPPANASDRRFDVGFYLRLNPNNKDDSDQTNWKRLPLLEANNPNSAMYGTFFLALDEAKHRDQRFKIQLKFKGAPADVKDSLARDAIYAAGVTIDGVDSFYHTGPNGKSGPKFVFAPEARKWVLTPPGRRIVATPGRKMLYPSPYFWGAKTTPQTLRDLPGRGKRLGLTDKERMLNGKLESVRGPGKSIVDLRGFQNGKKFADSFVFKTGAESVANLAGSVADVGEIKVYFYQEDLPLPTGVSASGVGAGAKLKNPVFPIRVRLRDQPLEVWTIKYRYINSKNPPPSNLTPVTGI